MKPIKKTLALILALISIVQTYAQVQTYTPQRVIAINQEGDKISIDYDDGYGQITFHSQNIVHYMYYPKYCSNGNFGTGILPSTEMVDVEFYRAGSWEKNYHYKSQGMEVDIHTFTGIIQYKDTLGNVLLETKGIEMTPARVQGESTYTSVLKFVAPEDEHYFGLGQHQSGWMDHKGITVQLWQDYEYHDGSVIAIPFMLTNKNYAIVYDNASRSTVTPGADGLTTWESEMSSAISYYVIHGNTTEEIYENYGKLCGFAPLPPKKSLGYVQCKQKYNTQQEVLDVVAKHKSKGYPIDYMIVDWFHWDVLGDMDMNTTRWPDAAAMNKELKEQDINCMISCWPRFKSESKNYDYLNKNGWFLTDKTGKTVNGTAWDDRGALIDITNPNASEWYWNTIHKNYTSRGFDSYWLDESEPDIVPHNFYLHKGAGAKIYNLYPYYHAKGVYDGHRRDLDERVFVLTRSSWLGTHQFGTAFWSSDIYPEWDVLERQIACGVNFCASGMPYWSSDIGGWHAFQRDRVAPAATRLLTSEEGPWRMNDNYPDYPEMYVRWFQYGAFSPTFRAHGTRSVNEVWSYGEEAEEIMVKYLELRYNMLPYIYSQAWTATTGNMPIMRGLWMNYMDDNAVMDIKDEYLWGSSILVAPVVKPGQTSRKVYLPKGDNWYDLWTNKQYTGGTSITAKAGIEIIPLYIKAGSIVPKAKDLKHALQELKEMDIYIYPGADAEFVLYDDEGTNYNYEEGHYATIKMVWNDAQKELTIEDRVGSFEGMVNEWSFNIVLVGSKTPAYNKDAGSDVKVVKYKGQKMVIKL